MTVDVIGRKPSPVIDLTPFDPWRVRGSTDERVRAART
jgi:hypothetical protein